MAALEPILERRSAAAPVRAAFVAATAREALAGIGELDRCLSDGTCPSLYVRRGIALATGASRARVGLLLPGQGVSPPADLGAFEERFPDAAASHLRAGVPSGTKRHMPPRAVQMAIVAASLTSLAAVRELGIEPGFALGHSLGELTALAWAGAVDEDTALRLARARGRGMAAAGAQRPGGMASVEAAPEALRQLAGGAPLAIACLNTPTRHVVSGPTAAIDAFLARAAAAGATATRLDVVGAFHSPLMEDAAAEFGVVLDQVAFDRPRGRVISSVTGAWLAPDTDMRAHLRHQILAPVRFLDAARIAAQHADLLIEAGPGSALATLMKEISDTPVISMRVGDRSPRRLLEFIATAWAAGIVSTRVLAAYVPDPLSGARRAAGA